MFLKTPTGPWSNYLIRVQKADKGGFSMSQVNAIYSKAVKNTKNKVLKDMKQFLEKEETLIPFQQYLENRNVYLDYVWANSWENFAANSVSRKEKIVFLNEKGHIVEGASKKLIAHLFRTEVRSYRSFDVKAWLIGEFAGNDQEWNKLYQQVRKSYLLQQEVAKIEKKKTDLVEEIEKAAQESIKDHMLFYYLNVRFLTGMRLSEHFEHNKRFKMIEMYGQETALEEDGSLQASDYPDLHTFFYELTGNISQHFYDFETYFEIYHLLVHDFINKRIPTTVSEDISPTLHRLHEAVFHEPLTSFRIREIIEVDLGQLAEDFLEELQNEQVSDLIELAAVPFEFTLHKRIYDKDTLEREKRNADHLLELERKKEEEARMLEDIFRREYSKAADENVRYILHIGETNTGKTYHALRNMMKADSGIYLAPLRLLALEVYDKLKREGIPCTLKTGEEEKVTGGARHMACTVEMFHEKDYYDVVVIDEAQMIADRDRGFSWYKAITKANAREVHIVGSLNLKEMILKLLGEENIEIHEYTRDIPLLVEKKAFRIKDTKKGDALVCFSRKRVLETASRLENSGFSVSMIYGSMPPETRRRQMDRFISGEAEVVVSTDAIGMGLNLPIRRIVFLETEKFDGVRRRRLTSQEIKQIAGRAGRKGIYDEGIVSFYNNVEGMKRLLHQKDIPVHTFAIAPTSGVFERFQKYSRDLGVFFELWRKFESPKGTEKASLIEERELYGLIQGTEIEARLSMMDLYGFLHLPFSTREPGLTEQWLQTMQAIVGNKELPEPMIKKRTLEDLELSYKAIGLHLLFLYKLEKRTEAAYWERQREQLSDEIHEFLKTEVKKIRKKCRNCGKNLSWDYPYGICKSCYSARYQEYDWDLA